LTQILGDRGRTNLQLVKSRGRETKTSKVKPPTVSFGEKKEKGTKKDAKKSAMGVLR